MHVIQHYGPDSQAEKAKLASHSYWSGDTTWLRELPEGT